MSLFLPALLIILVLLLMLHHVEILLLKSELFINLKISDLLTNFLFFVYSPSMSIVNLLKSEVKYCFSMPDIFPS